MVFEEGPQLIVSGAYWHDGLVARSKGEALNLNEPGVVRRFLDAALAAGVDAPAEVDGWAIYDMLVHPSGPTAHPTGTATRPSGPTRPQRPPGQDQRPVRPSSKADAAVPAVDVRSTLRPRR
ncbi:hypothetical protein V1460_29300 [Streptomyces sp. SCSIO 30461]|uniref:hypothetical protein n=1 Tax=Streptomyces sp. SCSIO 30461 TaxID=3118085 RepID=UPI0030CED271